MTYHYYSSIVSIIGGLMLFIVAFDFYKIKGQHFLIETFYRIKTLAKVISVFLLISGGYELYVLSTDKGWTQENKESIFKACKKMSASKDHPQLIEEYCDCAMNNIINNFTYDDFIKNTHKSKIEQEEIYKALYSPCLNDLDKKVKKIKSEK